MSRCKSCNVILSPVELRRVNEITDEPEDLCGWCSRIVFLDLNNIEIEERVYQFGDITERPFDYYEPDTLEETY
jgi:hypothetical protein